jgi:hypothetical protein
MPWTRKLKAPILLNDDRRVETLSDARKIIQGLPERHLQNEHWQSVAALLTGAAKDKSVSIDEVTAQLSRALKAEGLI